MPLPCGMFIGKLLGIRAEHAILTLQLPEVFYNGSWKPSSGHTKPTTFSVSRLLCYAAQALGLRAVGTAEGLYPQRDTPWFEVIPTTFHDALADTPPRSEALASRAYSCAHTALPGHLLPGSREVRSWTASSIRF